jgi:endonuclease YncB( thermonuclease family)
VIDPNFRRSSPTDRASKRGGAKRRVERIEYRNKIWSLLLAAAVAAAGPATHLAAQDAAAPPASDTPAATSQPPGGGTPTVVEWLNQTLRVRDTVQAVDQPSADGKPSSRIHAGAEVKAIGIVAGGEWVQIELPDRTLAYLPRSAVEITGKAGGQAQASEHPPEPATAAATGAAEPEPKPPADPVRGVVTKVPNAATLIVGDHRIRLSGIDPGPFAVLGSFENWLRGQGALLCEPDAQTGRYRCFTSNGVDVAEAAILNGAGRVGDGATPSYREREAEARQAHRGLWQGP